MSRKASVRTLACASGTPAAFSFSKYPGVSNVVVVIERFAFETICRQVPVFRLAGLTPPPEFLAVSAKRLRIRRAEMNFALPGSVALHGRNVLMASCTVFKPGRAGRVCQGEACQPSFQGGVPGIQEDVIANIFLPDSDKAEAVVMTEDLMLRIAGTVGESIVDGPGLRYVLFLQGCPHRCPGCHNPETHDFSGGREVSLAWVLADVEKNPITRGVTFSGGEPFCQCAALAVLARELRKRGYNLTAFSGYTYEQILADAEKRALLQELDILVDGPFLAAERSLVLRFRGSRNQRIIDVPASLAQGRAVLHELHDMGEQEASPVHQKFLCGLRPPPSGEKRP